MNLVEKTEEEMKSSNIIPRSSSTSATRKEENSRLDVLSVKKVISNNGKTSPSINAASAIGVSSGGIRPTTHGLVEFKEMRFLITEQPVSSSSSNILSPAFSVENFISILKQYKVCHLVSATSPLTYSVDVIRNETAIPFTNIAFEDGSTPPSHIIEQWLQLLLEQFVQTRNSISPSTVSNSLKVPESTTTTTVPQPQITIGVHCRTGLGRAPLLVAIALVELGMSSQEAVDHIRAKRPGAINTRQVEFLNSYKRRKYFSKRVSNASKRVYALMNNKNFCYIQ